MPWFARDLNAGRLPDLDACDETSDCTWIDCASAEDIAATIEWGVLNLGYAPRDIQVIAPQRKGACGVDALNCRLQAALNPQPEDRRLKLNAVTAVAAGDRVIHKRNDYSVDTFNGEVGYVVAAHWRGLDRLDPEWVWPRKNENAPAPDPSTIQMAVDYGDRVVCYTKESKFSVELAYCTTVHSAQGSGFPVVLMPVSSEHRFMLTRPLVYTAVTRTERQAVLVGERDALQAAASNVRGVERRTRLQELLTA